MIGVMNRFCCNRMQIEVTKKCTQHALSFDCPDNIVLYLDRFDEYGIIVHDGGRSMIAIAFCPWCGKKLPESKRDEWFGALEKLGFEDPFCEEIPDRFRTSEWYRAKEEH